MTAPASIICGPIRSGSRPNLRHAFCAKSKYSPLVNVRTIFPSINIPHPAGNVLRQLAVARLWSAAVRQFLLDLFDRLTSGLIITLRHRRRQSAQICVLPGFWQAFLNLLVKSFANRNVAPGQMPGERARDYGIVETAFRR